MKLMDQAWPVTPVQVSQGSLGADTALGGDTPIRGAGPEGIFTGRPLPEARVPVISPPEERPRPALGPKRRIRVTACDLAYPRAGCVPLGTTQIAATLYQAGQTLLGTSLARVTLGEKNILVTGATVTGGCDVGA